MLDNLGFDSAKMCNFAHLCSQLSPKDKHVLKCCTEQLYSWSHTLYGLGLS